MAKDKDKSTEKKTVDYPVEYLEHTEDHEFCYDPNCPCHEDPAAIGRLNQSVQDGLASVDDANRIYKGKTV